MAEFITLNLTPEVRATLENLLTVAGRLEDNARIVDNVPDSYGDLGEFQRSVYEPLKERYSVAEGPGENFRLDLQDANLVFSVLKGIDDGWVGGTPWMAMTPPERSAVEHFLETLRRP
jgi:hypothetical protein